MKLSTKILAGGAAVLVLAVVGFGAARYASAQTPAAGNGAQQQFLDRLAQNLNITPDELTNALTTTELQTVDDLLANGKITQAQADKLKDAINSGKGLGRLLFKRHEMREKAMTALRRQIVSSSSEAIGVSAQDLRGELQSGKSIADVAAEHSVSLDAVKSQITDDVKARLDTAVANGKITQTREDQAMQRLADNLDTILNRKKAA
jgi:uncharacterized protein YidB (DUF937 family)